jgi:soluble lytic murein transglycosylase-like protein
MKLPQRLAQWKDVVEPCARYYRLDSALVYAVMDRESNGGELLKPRGPGGTGDFGHGRGLMQIDDRAHPFTSCQDDTGRSLWADAWFNVSYACRLLARLMLTFNGDVAAAVGAYNTGAGNVRKALAGVAATASLEERVKAVDRYTAGHDYVRDVLKRRAAFLGEPGPVPPPVRPVV